MSRQPSPFRIIGFFLFTPLSFLWQLLNQFLLSSWGLVVPMALLIALVALQQIQKTPCRLAQFYAGQLETCDESDIPRLLTNLIQLGDAGVPGLVMGLSSNRESVFTVCRNVLNYEFDRWQESPHREHHFLVLSEALLQTCDQSSHAAQVEAMRFVDRIMKIRSDAASSPESTANRLKTIAHCELLYSLLESQRRRRIEPNSKEFVSSLETVASMNSRAKQPALLASNGKPFVPTSARQERDETIIADAGSFNPFSVPRADRLATYQKTQQNRPSEDRDNPRLPEYRDTLEIASSSSPTAFADEVERRYSQNFEEEIDISSEYRLKGAAENRLKEGTNNSESLLSPELRNTPLDHVPNLPTSQLMKLLHHPETSYIDSARRTLISRDGFQEAQLKLARRLYHPVPAVRQEIVAMLPNTPNIQSSVWLKVLLNDPSNDVRYRAASFLATTRDPALRRLLIERGKRDTDERIVNLANRLNDSQGHVRR